MKTNTIFELREFELLEYIENLSGEIPDPLLYYILKTIHSSKYDEILRNNNITHFSKYLNISISKFDIGRIIVLYNCIKVLIELDEIESDVVFNRLSEISQIEEVYEDLYLLSNLVILTKYSITYFNNESFFQPILDRVNSYKDFQQLSLETKSSHTLLLYQNITKFLLGQDLELSIEDFIEYSERKYIDYEFLEMLSYLLNKGLIPKTFCNITTDILRYHSKAYVESLISQNSTIDVDIPYFLSIIYNSFQGFDYRFVFNDNPGVILLEKNIGLFVRYSFNNLDQKIIDSLEELELSFNQSCYYSCMFLIRRIIEASLHIKAMREGKINEYQDSNGNVKDLKYIPDFAKDLGFISRYHAKDLNKLVQKTNNYIHNYRQPKPNENDLRDDINKLCEIIESLFH